MSKKQTHRPALDPNAANPREPFVAVPIKGEDTINPKEDKRRPTVRLLGTDGNAWAILGRIAKALRGAGYSKEEVDEYQAQATSDDYNHLIRVSCDWADVPMWDGEEEPCIICSEHEAKGDDDE